MRSPRAVVAVFGKIAAAAAWMAALMLGLVVLDDGDPGSLSARLFLAVVGLAGVGLVTRVLTRSGVPTPPPVPSLFMSMRLRGREPEPRAPGVLRIRAARRHRLARRNLADELALLAERRPGPTRAGPALTELRDGRGPATPELIGAALDELERS